MVNLDLNLDLDLDLDLDLVLDVDSPQSHGLDLFHLTAMPACSCNCAFIK